MFYVKNNACILLNKVLNSSMSLLLILCLTNVLLGFSINFLFISDNLYYQSFEEQLAISRIDEVIKLAKKWQWLIYVSIPLFTVSRIFLCYTCLFIGIYFVEIQINSSKLFRVALLGNFVFIFSGITKLVMLIFFKEISTIHDLQFTPFSLLSILGEKAINPLFEYPMNLLNIFELVYFFVLAWLLRDLLNEDSEDRSYKYGGALKLVAGSYGSGLLLWVVLNMFLTINAS